MPTRETALQRAARRTTFLLQRAGTELRVARIGQGMSTRQIGRMIGISHTQVQRIERGLAPHVDIEVLARFASVLGLRLDLGVHLLGAPVRDAAHLNLIREFRSALHPSIRVRVEVPMPMPGDMRSADLTLDGVTFDGIVEAETRLGDVQAVERQIRGKQQELGSKRAILLVLDSRHNRTVIDQVPELTQRFPIGTRVCLKALRLGTDPGGDCLVLVRTIATKRRLNATDPLTPDRGRSHPVGTTTEPV